MNADSRSHGAPVVVGVDGSAGSWAAIHLAAWEAGQRHAPLVLAYGYADVYPWFTPGPMPITDFDVRPEAERALARAAEAVSDSYPDLVVRTRLQPGPGAGVLVDASLGAALVVVGSRGSGGFLGLSLGSVAAQTAAHAVTPVLVVRGDAAEAGPESSTAVPPVVPRIGPVVVGVDGSPASEAAVEFAFQEATLRGVALVAMNVWWKLPEHNLGPDVPGHYDIASAKVEAQRLLAELLAGWSSAYPDVVLHQRPVLGMSPSFELIEASEDAGLVVVGSRGRGGFAGLLLGSVGRDLIGHAHCPVAVVHGPRVP